LSRRTLFNPFYFYFII